MNERIDVVGEKIREGKITYDKNENQAPEI
jgi:hypothetical protein